MVDIMVRLSGRHRGRKRRWMVFLGDHQPSSIAAGADASHDVPIAIVAKDPAVLDPVDGWGLGGGAEAGAHDAGVADGRFPGSPDKQPTATWRLFPACRFN
ncbi:hypothetical protein ACQP2X_34010 [Actinoplanes sp. CA-131856]